MANKVELKLDFQLTIKVKGHSESIPVDELRKRIEDDVVADVEQYMQYCSGIAGCSDDNGGRTYGYDYVAEPLLRKG